jgi:hypothetical protein
MALGGDDGDMASHLDLALDNTGPVLTEAGSASPTLSGSPSTRPTSTLPRERRHDRGTPPQNTRYASTLLGVARLGFLELLVELEATAVQ